MTFTCSRCGQEHQGFADLAFPAPYYYYTVPTEERDQRSTLSSDLCSIDDQDFFIRGCLEIPIIGLEETFTWGAWCSVSRKNFDKYREILADRNQSQQGPFFGWFSVLLPTYPDTLQLKVMAHLRDGGIRPSFELEESDHALSVDYRSGVTVERLQQIYEAALHSSDQ